MSFSSVSSLRRDLDEGALSPRDLVQKALERMERLEGGLSALVHRDPEAALRAADAAALRLARGERGPLLGIPVILKDNLAHQGHPHGNASAIMAGFRAPFSATVVSRLLEAGAVPMARANMDEFAMGSSGEYSASGPTRNPWDPSRVPGGSSSGSAAAVAAGYAPLALGTDTGGSVRLPAGFCNLTALRPTYGVLSRYGVTAMASSLDQVGPLARSARDLAAALEVLAGRDPMDSTSLDLPGREELPRLRPAQLRGLRVGLPREYFDGALDGQARSVLEAALERLREAGVVLVELSLPHTACAIDVYYLVVTSEVSSNLARFDGVRYGRRAEAEERDDGDALLARSRDRGLGAEVKRRILLGAFCLSRQAYEALYLKALRARSRVAEDFRKAFAQVDLLAAPLSPGTAFPLGEKSRDPLAMYLADTFTVPAALAGIPALAMPAGFVSCPGSPAGRLPVGIQLLGPALADVRLLETAMAFQELTDHHLQMPVLPA